MPEAAHLTHQVTHTYAMSGLITGVVIGAAAAVTFVVVVGTGGVALVAASMVCTGIAAGGSFGEFVGRRFEGPDCGPIIAGSPTVFFEGLPAARVMDLIACSGGFLSPPHPGSQIAQGSSSVWINSLHAARLGDKATCGATINHGCSTIIIGGETVNYLEVGSEIPTWVHAGLSVIGLFGFGSKLKALGYTSQAIASILGAVAVVGPAGSWTGGKIADYMDYPEGSWQRDALVLVGGTAGSLGTMKAGMKISPPYTVNPSKFNYFFGKVTTGKPSNIARSAQNLKDLNIMGIRTKAQLTNAFSEAYKNPAISVKKGDFGTTVVKSVEVGKNGKIEVGFFYKDGNMASKPSVSSIIPKIWKSK